MTARELITMLAKADPNEQVCIWDPDADRLMPVSGMSFGKGMQTNLYTDTDPDEEEES